MPENWNAIAETRKRQIEHGIDLTFCNVMLPYYVNHIKDRNLDRVLEIGAGTGHLSKTIASLVPEVVAIEPSDGMYDIASEILANSQVNLLKRRADQIADLGQFDLVLSHLCLQAVSNPSVFLMSVTDALATSIESRFLCSIPHPCFYNDYKKFFSESEYCYMNSAFKKIDLTITKEPDSPIRSVPYYHRPLSTYFDLFKEARMTVVDFDEIFPSPDTQSLYGHMWETPRYCVFHLKSQKTQ